MKSNDLIKEIEKLELLRIKGLIEQDFDLLANILPNNLTHVHSNGHLQNRDELFERMSTTLEYLKIERGTLNYRFYNNSAVVTGTMKMTFRMRKTQVVSEATATVTQVWIKKNQTWVQVSFQSAKHI